MVELLPTVDDSSGGDGDTVGREVLTLHNTKQQQL